MTRLPVIDKPISIVSNFLYVEPITSCNLKCKMCYTNVVNGPNRKIVDADQLLAFVRRFVDQVAGPSTVYWCGTGEVFLHRELPRMVNELDARYPALSQIIQTNGTVHRLRELDSLARIDFQVSIDGQKPFHEWHRGANTYDRTIAFCREAKDRGAKKVTIRTLLTTENVTFLGDFHDELTAKIGEVTLSLLVPYTNEALLKVRRTRAIAQKDIDDSKAISKDEAARIVHERWGDRFRFEDDALSVENYMAVTPDGVHTCCNGIVRIGGLEMETDVLVRRLARSGAACKVCPLFPCM